jgi:hypothetical protein
MALRGLVEQASRKASCDDRAQGVSIGDEA